MILNRKGQSLVQVLVSIGLVALLAGVMAQVMVDQHRQIRAIETKQEAIDFRNLLTMTLMNSSGCCPIGNSSVADFNIQEGSSTDISVGAVFSFCPNGSNPNPPKLFQSGNDNDYKYFRVKSVSLININRPDPAGAPSQYMANLKVDVENKDANGRALPALLFPLNFATSQIPTEPPSSSLRKVTSCSTVNAAGALAANSGLPIGMQVYSTPGNYVFKVPSGVTRIKVELWGGGAAGWDYDLTGNSYGGGSGGYSADLFDVKPGSSYFVGVGSGDTYSDGEDSTFSNLLTAGGGEIGGKTAGFQHGGGGLGKGRLGMNGFPGANSKFMTHTGAGPPVGSKSGYGVCQYTSGAPGAFGRWGAGGSACPPTAGGNGRAVITW